MRNRFFWPVLLLATVSSCDLFRLREPEPGGGGQDFATPLQPSIVVDNLQAAYEGGNIENYRSCFDQEDFVFRPDPADTIGAFQELLRAWDFGAEDSATVNLFASVSASGTPLTLTLVPLSADSTDTTAYFYESYELVLPLASLPLVRGKAKLSLVRVETFWYLAAWEDFRADTTDWGQLRASFRR